MKKAIAVILLVGIFAVGCIFIPYIVYQEYSTYKDYTENGYTVECTATAVAGRKKNREITAEYRDRDGVAHTYTLRKAYATISTGDKFTAYVLPDKPEEFWIRYDIGDITGRLVVYGIVFLVGLLVPIYAIGSMKESRILKERGKTVSGVVARSYVNRNNFRYGVIVFETERGREVTGEVQLERYQRDGETVAITYAYDDKGKLWWRC